MALARSQETYYYAPAYMAAIPAALWVFRGSRARALPIFAWPLIAIVVVPQLGHLRDNAQRTKTAERAAASLERPLVPLMKPGVVIVTPLAVPDTQFALAQFFADYTPNYPFRFVGPYRPFIQLAEGRGLKIGYYAGPAALGVKGTADIDLAGLGTFRVRRLAEFDDPLGSFGVLQIVSTPAGL